VTSVPHSSALKGTGFSPYEKHPAKSGALAPEGLLYSAPAFAYRTNVDYSQIITMEPGKRSSKPCVHGTRITVVDVLEYLASGMTHAEILADFPQLTEADILACLAFAADRESELTAATTYSAV